MGTSFFIVLSLGICLNVKNYPLKIGRSIGLTIVLWIIIYLLMFKISAYGYGVLCWITWGLCATVYVSFIRIILKVKFRYKVWLAWLICTLSLFFAVGDFKIAKFVWVFGMALVPVFAEMYDGAADLEVDIELDDELDAELNLE